MPPLRYRKLPPAKGRPSTASVTRKLAPNARRMGAKHSRSCSSRSAASVDSRRRATFIGEVRIRAPTLLGPREVSPYGSAHTPSIAASLLCALLNIRRPRLSRSAAYVGTTGQNIQHLRGELRLIRQAVTLSREPLYEPGGREFESLRARQYSKVHSGHMGNRLFRRHR
jgi:hypothetical protein